MRDSHVDPGEAVRIFEALDPARALAVHWGTFQLSFEAINDPPRALAEQLRGRDIAPDRFVATEVGQSFRVPAR
jgi:N-acyl-phosphatidylethanolamine-hydrolysing phospholipase D